MLGVKSRKKLRAGFEPQADYGFFGPGSVTWKVWSYPTSYVLGFVRAVTIEHLDPNLAAAVIQSGGVKYRPNTRYARTLRYFGMVAFGASEPTAKAADVLVRVHSKAIGHDPITGGTYDANDPSSQLWIHMTAWHSILYCYEKFGPGKLSPEEEAQYWTECARAAELQTIDPASVPRSREGVIEYFDQWRPHLAVSEGALDMVHFILPVAVALPPGMPAWQKKALAPVTKLLSMGVVATYPRYMRELFGLKQGPITDAVVTVLLRAAHTVLHRSVRLAFLIGNLLAPEAFKTLAPVLLGVEPLSPVTMTPREAQAKYGFDIPTHAHPAMRSKQHDRVFNNGDKPSDEGLVESENLIGSMKAS